MPQVKFSVPPVTMDRVRSHKKSGLKTVFDISSGHGFTRVRNRKTGKARRMRAAAGPLARREGEFYAARRSAGFRSRRTELSRHEKNPRTRMRANRSRSNAVTMTRERKRQISTVTHCTAGGRPSCRVSSARPGMPSRGRENEPGLSTHTPSRIPQSRMCVCP